MQLAAQCYCPLGFCLGRGDYRGTVPGPRAHAKQGIPLLDRYSNETVSQASYVEIYNEKIRDLLRPGTAHSDRHAIVHNPGGCPEVSGVEREEVSSVEAAAGLVRRAAAARTVESTQVGCSSPCPLQMQLQQDNG